MLNKNYTVSALNNKNETTSNIVNKTVINVSACR